MIHPDQPETPKSVEELINKQTLEYKAGRRDALKSFYAVVTGRPNLLRDETVELLRQAVIDAERKLRTDPNYKEPNASST
jgi:hypothetical protein